MSKTASSAQLQGPVAYLASEYPKVSHTFILREIASVRRQGVDVLTCTVRRAGTKDVVGADQQAEADCTFAVLEAARKAPLKVPVAHLGAFARSPRRWFQALVLAWKTRPPGLKAGLWQFFYFVEAGILADYLHRKKVVHLHNHFANSGCSVALLTSVMSGIPYSFTLHGPTVFFQPKWWRIDAKVAGARFVACISHFARSQAMLFSDEAHWNKLKIVHCGIRLEDYGNTRVGSFSKRVLFVGRLDAVKGMPLLIDAFAAVLDTHPDAQLTIIGDGPARAKLEERAKTLGKTVTFLGYQPQEEVARLLGEMDMLVLPSFAEGVPVVLMEAMASRLPVIASRVAGIPELVEDGVSGFLVPPGDLESLTARLEELLGDPALCAKMGEAGRAMVEAEFDIEREAARLVELYGAKDVSEKAVR
ncbi:MAG: colanic acid biosynthesis glycosyltransferase WcaL [Ahrensia sp.]|nr:colanic acid biosynthesis glycosyltransferase WcaL [Ahrensia sp.]